MVSDFKLWNVVDNMAWKGSKVVFWFQAGGITVEADGGAETMPTPWT